MEKWGHTLKMVEKIIEEKIKYVKNIKGTKAHLKEFEWWFNKSSNKSSLIIDSL